MAPFAGDADVSALTGGDGVGRGEDAAVVMGRSMAERLGGGEVESAMTVVMALGVLCHFSWLC